MTDSLREELVSLTSDLIRFRSTADRPEQLNAALTYVHSYLEQLPGLYLHRSERNGKPALVVTLHDTHSPALLLNGHVDVVAADDEHFSPQVKGGRIYGRGSMDMKGSIAVLMRLLKDLAEQEERPDVGVQFVSDEEIGGADGTERLLEEGWTCEFFIAAEPTNLEICHEQKGGIWLSLSIAGAPGHASRPWEAENPISELSAGLQALFKRFPALEEEEWQTTVTPTLINTTSISANQIPSEIKLSIDIRRVASDKPENLMSAVQECFPTATVTPRRIVRGMITPPDHPRVQQLASVITRVRGSEPDIIREHFGSDARFYTSANMPAVCFGPEGEGLHSDKEWVEISSLVDYHELLHAFIREF